MPVKELRDTILTILFLLVLVAFPASYLVVHDSFERQVMETILWMLLIFFSTLLSIFFPERNKITATTISLSLLMLYIFADCYFQQRGIARLLLYTGGIISGWYGIKNFITHFRHKLRPVLITAGLIIFISYLMLFVPAANKVPYQQNPSLFGILLAAQLLFFVPYCLGEWKNNHPLLNWLTMLAGCFALFLLVVSDSRSGWIGMIAGMLYLVYQYLPRYRRILFLIAGCCLLILITGALLFYKPGSSNGRILIYKISWGMFAGNPLTGSGAGGFSQTYNRYQAGYFHTHSIDAPEALLADNTWFAFNDYYQFMIENGIAGILLVLLTLFLLAKRIRQAGTSGSMKHPSFAAASLVCVLTAALFYYPLQFFPVVFHVMLCAAVLTAKQNRPSPPNSMSRHFYSLLKVMTGILLLAGYSFYLQYQLREQKAYYAVQSGLNQQALEDYQQLALSPFADGNLLFQYARRLYAANQLENAKAIMARVKKRYSSIDAFKLSALVHEGLNEYEAAGADYTSAVMAIPNRMVNRYDLLSFYIARRDTLQIRYWANSILQMPVKVPSPVTRSFRQSAAAILKKYNTATP